jgi:hypothetical protein
VAFELSVEITMITLADLTAWSNEAGTRKEEDEDGSCEFSHPSFFTTSFVVVFVELRDSCALWDRLVICVDAALE